MARLSTTRRHLALGVAVASSLAMAAATAAPGVAGATGHHARHSAAHHQQVRVVASKKFGKILVDSSGRTLYEITAGAKSPKCSGACAGIWPPLLTKGKPRAGKGVEGKLLGTVKRGKEEQVTYHGWPLYTFKADKKAGQTLGEGIKNFGGTWYLVGKHGGPVKAALTSKSSGSNSSSGGYGSSSSGGSSTKSGGW